MAATEELVVAIGLDADDFRQNLAQVFLSLDESLAGLRDFLDGFAQGFNQAVDEVVEGTEGSAQALAGVSDAAEGAAASLEETGQRGGQALGEAAEQAGALSRELEGAAQAGQGLQQAGMQAGRLGGQLQTAGATGNAVLRETARQAEATGAKIRDAGNGITQLGTRWGGMLRGMIRQFAAPVLGAFATGSIVNSYFSGVAQVAQMTGRYSTQLEEWRKKRELLSRVTREDIELYRDGKLALLNFNFAMQSLSTTIMRALAPPIRAIIEALNGFSDWVRANEHNIVRFFQAVGIVVSMVVVPAFIKWAAVMLANPISWVIIALGLLVLVIDDLLTYIRGGNSALAGFWSRFGTGQEISEKLARAWQNLQRIGERLFDALRFSAQKFIEYFGPAFDPLADTLEAFIELVANILEGDFEAAFQSAQDMVEGFKNYVVSLIDGMAKLILGIFDGIIEGVKNWGGELLEAAPDWVQDLLGVNPDTAKPELAQYRNNPGAMPVNAALPSAGAAARAGMSAAAAGSRVNNVDTHTNIQHMTINTQATDAQGIFNDATGALQQASNRYATAAADGGVVQ